MIYLDRADAGQKLARALLTCGPYTDAIVLGLPRGGVPVAYEVAKQLNLPLDVLVVRKLGVPGQEELAMGAVAPGGLRVLNAELIAFLGLDTDTLELVTAQETIELERRMKAYRGEKQALFVTGKTVLLVDDGMATGATMLAAVRALRALLPLRIVVAAPVGSHESCTLLAGEADEVICLATPKPFYGVGHWYRSFEQTSDSSVRALL